MVLLKLLLAVASWLVVYLVAALVGIPWTAGLILIVFTYYTCNLLSECVIKAFESSAPPHTQEEESK